MTDTRIYFTNLEKLLKEDESSSQSVFSILKKEQDNLTTFTVLSEFLDKLINEIDKLATEIKTNDNILVSVKDQKLLRTCFQVIVSLGVCPCLIPGLGLRLSKRCATADYLPTLNLDDEKKYETLKKCTNFIYRSYDIPVLKNIILTFHLSDYLAALIQLSFAPLKKPGNYTNYVMTDEMYQKFMEEKHVYKMKYEYLVKNCFQPMLMKELLVLQNVTDVQPPAFVKRVITKEMSLRLTAPGGLLSLIRCFLECHNLDTGLEWKKIDMICRIVSTKHGNMNENDYITNICGQLKQILSLNNTQYLTTATSCLLSLYEKYNDNTLIEDLTMTTFKPFQYDSLLKKSLPGTIILSPQDIDHHVQVLHSSINICKFETFTKLMLSNLYVLYLLSLKCNKQETKNKINEIIMKGLESLDQKEIKNIIDEVLFGKEHCTNICVEIYEAGLAIKHAAENIEYPTDKAVQLFIELFNLANNDAVISKLFQATLQIFMSLNDEKKKIVSDKETLMALEDNPVVVSSIDEKYMNILHILSEISSSKKVLSTMKGNPVIVVDFVENLILKNAYSRNDECVTIALVLLNTILANTDKASDIKHRLQTLLPFLKITAKNDQSNLLSILCKETVSLISSEYPKPLESAYQKALENIFDDLLPVRAHGVMELTKLIDDKDPETLSKRHIVFCLFQEQLKNTDSYLYLSAINGISSLATHCTDDVIAVLCKEFCSMTIEDSMQIKDQENKIAEMRMKIGDIIVKVTRRLGEMAIVHKSILLNTMLCGCRDQDPLIRTSALSNLAEIALVLHYRIGTIIYEILLCVWSIIESDPAIECRRAAVMIITSLLKGLGKDTLVELKENLLPMYRTLNKLYKDEKEDPVLRLHAQLALEEINEIVKQFLNSELPMEKQFSLLNESEIKFK